MNQELISTLDELKDKIDNIFYAAINDEEFPIEYDYEQREQISTLTNKTKMLINGK